MKALDKIKFRDKIALSFGGLIVLVAINALVGIYTAYSISDQIKVQKDVARIVDEIVRMRDATEHYKGTGARKAALQTFTILVQVKEDIERTGAHNAHVTSLISLLDDFWLSFQKFVIETDQKSALESRTMQLGRSMVSEINDARTRRTIVHDHETFDTLVGEILNLQWQGQELRSRAQATSPELLANIRSTLSKLREPVKPQVKNIEAQRQLYRILQDATDYMNSFEDHRRYQVLYDQSEQDLSHISEQLQAAAWRFSEDASHAIQRQIPSSIALMLAVFLLTLIGSVILARTLSREILKPILGLLKTTQAITLGRLDARAEIAVDDEIGELARSFNQMTDGLRTLQGELESRVTDRTQQLAEANQALENEINVRKNAEATIAEREQHLRTIIDLVPQFIFAKNTDGQFILANRAVAEYYGTTPENLVGKTDQDFNSNEAQIAHFFACDQKVLLSRRELYISEEPITDATGETRYFETTKIPYFDEARTGIPSVLGVSVDITERKLHQKQLEHIAHYDALTDLPNRVLLADRLKQTMAQALRHNDLLAVVYLDLDGFKAINDKYGHDLGDRLLRVLAVRLKQALREGDTLARIGGDEFVGVLLDLHDHTDSAPVLERLLETAAEPIPLDGLVLQVSASLGVTYFPQSDEVDADQLLRQADQAMYLAKQAGKNRYHIFDAEQDRSVRGHHEELERIRQALANDEFVLYYQPKVNMRSGQVIGAEALIRWQHPERGIVPPGTFLPLIENHVLSIDIGEWVLENALKQIGAWRNKGLVVPVSINIDPIHFEQSNFMDRLRQRLAQHPEVHPGDLELEVLETSALEDIAQLSEIMAACHEIGVGFALDDFGTGYSSLTYLKRLPASLLRIDRSFVHDMLDDPEDLAILEGVLGLATAFRRQVIAEGVETLAHGELLLQMGCEWGQGYAIAKPMPASEIEHWIRQWHPAPAWAHCPQVKREDIPILFALVELRAWIATLGDFMRDDSPRPLPKSNPLGRFGQWLGNEAPTSRAGAPDIERIAALHQNLQRLSHALGDLKAKHETGQMHACFNEIKIIHEDLMNHLKQFVA